MATDEEWVMKRRAQAKEVSRLRHIHEHEQMGYATRRPIRVAEMKLSHIDRELALRGYNPDGQPILTNSEGIVTGFGPSIVPVREAHHPDGSFKAREHTRKAMIRGLYARDQEAFEAVDRANALKDVETDPALRRAYATEVEGLSRGIERRTRMIQKLRAEGA